MKKYRRSNTFSSQGVYLKKNIARNRRRAKFVGVLYLLATIALAAVACFPLIVDNALAPIGVTEFYKQFKTLSDFDVKNTTELFKTVNCALYALMLLGLAINVLRALSKLGWLFKKSANQTYGFNRNVYAMQDLGNMFSGSFAVILATYFLIAVLCGEGVKLFSMENMYLLIALGVGVGVHILAGFWGAKTAYYDLENGDIIEQKRVIGRFAPAFRNLLQVAASCAVMYFFLQISTLHTAIPELLEDGGVDKIMEDMAKLINLAVQVVVLLCTLVLVKHATATTEFSIDGIHGPGMKNYRVFSFFVFLAAGADVAYKYFVSKQTELADHKNMLIIAGIGFVMFVIELIMRKYPRFPEEKFEKKQMKKAHKQEKKASKREPDMGLETFIRPQAIKVVPVLGKKK